MPGKFVAFPILVAMVLPAFAGNAPIAVAPLHATGTQPAYPRLTAFPDETIRTRVNKLLAEREREDRANYADCLEQAKQANVKLGKDDNWMEITVVYLSRRFLSIDRNVQSYCGGPYPASAQMPLTYDLTSAQEVNWPTLFKPGFWPETATNGKLSGLSKIYRKRYHFEKGDEDCRDAIMKQDPFEEAPGAMLDAKQGLVVWPDFPHVIQACANSIALKPAELMPYVKDKAFLADLQSTVKPGTGKGASK